MKHFCSFSEAIREGAKIRPQGFGAFAKHGPQGKSCAILAGAEAITGKLWIDDDYQLVKKPFPYLLNKSRCPVGCSPFLYVEKISDVLYHLNDVHRWTREQIADWLESEEEKIGFITLTESESSSKSLQRAVLSV